jgi:hypothetical protein
LNRFKLTQALKNESLAQCDELGDAKAKRNLRQLTMPKPRPG